MVIGDQLLVEELNGIDEIGVERHLPASPVVAAVTGGKLVSEVGDFFGKQSFVGVVRRWLFGGALSQSAGRVLLLDGALILSDPNGWLFFDRVVRKVEGTSGILAVSIPGMAETSFAETATERGAHLVVVPGKLSTVFPQTIRLAANLLKSRIPSGTFVSGVFNKVVLPVAIIVCGQYLVAMTMSKTQPERTKVESSNLP